MKVTEDGTEILKLCIQFWVIFRITHTEKILNHLKVIRELQCAEVVEPS